MNVVLDTNIIVSGLIYEGKPGLIVDLATTDQIKAITSQTLVNELCAVLDKKFKYNTNMLQRIRRFMSNVFIVVTPDFIPNIIKEDPPDNQVLAITHVMPIQYIISGNKHLLKLKKYNDAIVVKPSEFLTIVQNSNETY